MSVLVRGVSRRCRPNSSVPSRHRLTRHCKLSQSAIQLTVRRLRCLNQVIQGRNHNAFITSQLTRTAGLARSCDFARRVGTVNQLPRAAVLRFYRVRTSGALSVRVKVHLNRGILGLGHLQVTSNVPVVIRHDCLPTELFVSLGHPLLRRGPLCSIVRRSCRRGVQMTSRRFSTNVTHPYSTQLLNVDRNTPILSVIQAARGARGSIIRFALSITHTSGFGCEVSRCQSAI